MDFNVDYSAGYAVGLIVGVGAGYWIASALARRYELHHQETIFGLRQRLDDLEDRRASTEETKC